MKCSLGHDTTDWVGELRGKPHASHRMRATWSVEPNVTAATQLIEVCKDQGLLVGKEALRERHSTHSNAECV